MTKSEAYEAMLNGFKVRNEYYSPEEFAFINREGLIELEDGVVAGTKDDEFWAIYQAWENGWETCGEREPHFTPPNRGITPAIMGMEEEMMHHSLTHMHEPMGLNVGLVNEPFLITNPYAGLSDTSGPMIINKSYIPRRESNVYTQRKPKEVKRKRTPKTFGKKKH